MFRFRGRAYLLVFLTIFITTSVLAATKATPTSIINENPLAMDAKAYADELDVPLDRAIQRLMLQDLVGELDAELAGKEYETYAGLWIQHTPEFRIIVQFTQGDLETIRPYIEHEELVDIIEVRKANVPLVNLKVTQDTILYKTRDLSIPVESGINVFENHVELYVKEPSQLDAALQKSGIQLPSNVLVVRVDELSTNETQIFAGLELRTCTSGYSVIHSSGTEGITTAAHCDNSQTFSGIALGFVDEIYEQDQDVQWHTTSGLTVRNLAFDGSGNRYVYSTKHRVVQALNSWVCKHGRTTGYTCGFIIDKNFKKPDDPPHYFNATWIRVHNDGVNISAGGDSGCPYFLGNTAYGIHSSGIGDDGLYMAINYISALDLSVILSTIHLPLVYSGGQSQTRSNGAENPDPYPAPNYETKSIVTTPSTQPIPYP
ncbi:S1 family peptidase [Chloroflexota bacterium]